MTIAIISVCSFISCQCMHLMVIEWINWLIIFAVRKGNIISFNIVKIHFTLKTPSLPMQQIVTNLWEDLKTLWVFGFFVELLVVWGFVCVWRVWGVVSLIGLVFWFFQGLEAGRLCLFVGGELLWGNISNMEQASFQKQCLSHFCLLVWASRLHRPWTIPQFWWLLWPPVLSDCFLPDQNPESLRSQISCTHHKQGTGKCVTFRQQLIPHGLKTIFPMLWTSFSVSFQGCLQLWNFLFSANLWWEGKEMPFNSNFKMF